MYKNGPPPPGFVPPPPYSPHAPPPQPQGPNVVIMTSPQVGPDPTTMTCPYCQSTITTNMETEASTKTHLFFLLLCLIGCWPCAPCVYCADSCMAKKHYCPNCHKFLGVYDG
ncbi:lipopolysaccharide-induced tumor necrosis factor-alpha factor homolog [Phymastichus coffea]|uniref:lipopolysaccharide-induced tumor necrosis factor-alpha factor homolog n=1 Tax=Phymastichus coffea TaxID=108790 RepID=UPI00273BF44B|nr:lipopolysaccharide-induced tumor necrosis factor-alpha factor homolog [Phymastichus coffea]